MADNVLKEFLVALGWKNDDVAMRKALDGVEKFGKEVAKLAVAAEVASLAAVAALGKIAQGFENLYYTSKRTGSTVQDIKAFGYAVSQMGGNAEEAVASLEALAVKMKANPKGYDAFIKTAGRLGGVKIDTSGGAEKIEEQLGKAFAGMNSTQQRAFAGEFGLSESLLNALLNYKELRKYQDEYAAKAKIMNVDLQQAAQDGKDLSSGFRSLGATFGVLKDAIGSALFKSLTPTLEKLNAFILSHGKEIAAAISDIAKALLELFSFLVESLPAIDAFVQSIGGWKTVFIALAAVFVGNKLLGPLTSMFSILNLITKLAAPAWLLGLIAILPELALAGGAAALGYAAYRVWTDPAAGAGGASGSGGAGGGTPANLGGGKGMTGLRGFANRMKQKVGLGGGGAPASSLPDGRPGTYRPSHSLSAEDLSDAVVNTIAGEAQGNQNSIDAVINNMMNRVGTRAYGPSDNLGQVAGAEGQYAAYNKGRPSAEKAAYIRARIRAIASGSVPDNTRGSNEFRAGGYAGPWGRRHANAPVIGGNRFAFNPASGKGAYAPYDSPNIPANGGYTPKLDGSPVPIPKFVPSQFDPPILGRIAPQTSNDNRIHMPTSTTINVTGVSDPNQAAAQVGANMSRQHSTLLRNLQSAIG